MSDEYKDPFASYDKTPAVSFANQGKGYKTRVTVLELPKMVQARDFETDQPAFWPAKPGQEPNPKMTVVIKVEEDGETRSLWAPKPSSLFAAIRDAQKESGQLQVGSVIDIEITDVVQRTDANGKPKKGKPKKEYGAAITQPDAFADDSDTPPWER